MYRGFHYPTDVIAGFVLGATCLAAAWIPTVERAIARVPERGTLPAMTTILIAADDSEESIDAARVAHALFGDDAEYLVIHVRTLRFRAAPWHGATRTPSRCRWSTTRRMLTEPAPGEPTQVEEAEDRADAVAHAASLDSAEAVGDVGDTSEAILHAAHEHGADVIVVGSHERGWFSRLLSGSVSQDVIRRSDIPVLVVK